MKKMLFSAGSGNGLLQDVLNRRLLLETNLQQ
ncbi:Uncharacterised protein [Escherichia coli]|nr:Uncharacterised protein [Escherichia coli]